MACQINCKFEEDQKIEEIKQKNPKKEKEYSILRESPYRLYWQGEQDEEESVMNEEDNNSEMGEE